MSFGSIARTALMPAFVGGLLVALGIGCSATRNVNVGHNVDGGADADGCIDADGDGFGENCPDGPDCDDDNPHLGAECPDCEEDPYGIGCPCDEPEPEVCYSGPENTMGIGLCRSGLRSCIDGGWGPCDGEVAPSDEIRNGEDDDCNGFEDDGLCGALDDCAGHCCKEGEVCVGMFCREPGDCTDDADCDNDTHCVPGRGCIPYEDGETNEDCVGDPIPVDEYVQELLCAYSDPPEDEMPTHIQVMSTPTVAHLDLSEDPDSWRPSIVFNTFAGVNYKSDGVLRIIDGATCELQQSLTDPADRTIGASPASIGDLDGDGLPEIVTAHTNGGLVAFTQDHGRYVRMWISAVCDGGGGRVPDGTGGQDKWSGASIHDLDDDGVPEVIYGAVVYDADGCVIDQAQGFRSFGVGKGQVPVLADVDLDGEIEWVAGNALLRWDGGRLVPEADFAPGGLDDGFVAVADFGEFPDAAGDAPGVAEIAVIAPGWGRIQTIGGDVVFGPFTYEGLYRGGPPTIADFDGDGEQEFASAGGDRYVVFDPECDEDVVPDHCEARGIRWSQPSQDHSSNMTGSSVFDFEGDGAAEAVYADECFIRVYDGSTGEVKFSASRSSGTTYENPVIVDVDADFRSEIVTSTNDYAAVTIGCPDNDPLFPDAEHEHTHGIRIYQDIEDRWADSRPIWNQHAYSVTNVEEDGTIPRTSDWERNWEVEGLNNFRQNVQGSLVPLAEPDLTARGDGWTDLCPDRIELRAVIANRGMERVPRGVSVGFYVGAPPEAGGLLACQTHTADEIPPGGTARVTCDWLRPGADLVDIYVRADHEGTVPECEEGNGDAMIPHVQCEIVG